ncbi:FHA domain-containing protein [Ferdinandcohnia quinoae]|uniref:FHA domain-containing protein n=1 Tax=Fredinandcohnia quinoae TaxID=2918902 RepID=A0AAW5E6P4_9BACI|nr:FHA domain-containing protein [Fredinandcohnia sp. SECRCQ15]MCH1625692.1 FHA domain-containing protein [Fredinandcohnia sp. SECRCQ15]
MKRCSNGHYYDEIKHSLCPHCGVNIDLNLGVTMPKRSTIEDDLSKTQAIFPNASTEIGKTVAKIPTSQHDDGKTIAVIRKEIGIDPVVGWLVCVEGPDKGKDYKIRSERNFIGRSEKMDICISGDEAISRENHAIISYSPKKRLFRIYPGDSRGLVYLNDEEVITADELQVYDVIEIGKTKLIFIPFCSKHFEWD